MARKLNARQKKLLDKWMKDDSKFNGDITQSQEDELNKISLFEDLLGCVDRYVGDKRLKELYG